MADDLGYTFGKKDPDVRVYEYSNNFQIKMTNGWTASVSAGKIAYGIEFAAWKTHTDTDTMNDDREWYRWRDGIEGNVQGWNEPEDIGEFLIMVGGFEFTPEALEIQNAD